MKRIDEFERALDARLMRFTFKSKLRAKLRAKTIAPDESESRTRLQETERIDAQK